MPNYILTAFLLILVLLISSSISFYYITFLFAKWLSDFKFMNWTGLTKTALMQLKILKHLCVNYFPSQLNNSLDFALIPTLSQTHQTFPPKHPTTFTKIFNLHLLSLSPVKLPQPAPSIIVVAFILYWFFSCIVFNYPKSTTNNQHKFTQNCIRL